MIDYKEFKKCVKEWEALEKRAGDKSVESRRCWERRYHKRLQLFDLITMCEQDEDISDDQRKELFDVKVRLNRCLADENARMIKELKQQEESGQPLINVNDILRDAIGDLGQSEDDTENYDTENYDEDDYDPEDDENEQEDQYKALRSKAEKIVKRYAKKGYKWGCVPVAANFSYPITFSKMIHKLAHVYGLSLSLDDIESIVAMWLGAGIMFPVFGIPVLSGSLAKDLLKDYGNEFIDAAEHALKKADGTESDREILNSIASDIRSRKKEVYEQSVVQRMEVCDE